MYKTEKDFYNKSIHPKLKEHFKCVRLESRATHTGIPDVLIMGDGINTFIELKVLPNKSIHDNNIKVPWRPGQLAFAAEYFIVNTTKKFIEGVSCIKVSYSWTAVAMKDGVILVKHGMQNSVDMMNIGANLLNAIKPTYVFKYTWEQWRQLNLIYFIRLYTNEYVLGDLFTFSKYADILIADNVSFVYGHLDLPADDEWDSNIKEHDSAITHRAIADVVYTLLTNHLEV